MFSSGVLTLCEDEKKVSENVHRKLESSMTVRSLLRLVTHNTIQNGIISVLPSIRLSRSSLGLEN